MCPWSEILNTTFGRKNVNTHTWPFTKDKKSFFLEYKELLSEYPYSKNTILSMHTFEGLLKFEFYNKKYLLYSFLISFN